MQNKSQENKTIDTTHDVFDRVLKKEVPGIPTDKRFKLDTGFYISEDETILIKSTNETGRYFRKVSE